MSVSFLLHRIKRRKLMAFFKIFTVFRMLVLFSGTVLWLWLLLYFFGIDFVYILLGLVFFRLHYSAHCVYAHAVCLLAMGVNRLRKGEHIMSTARRISCCVFI